ncbi:cryptochrome/photolyase family protein [Roseospira goensis]|uniref:Deoxyribodipyrimidine photolyase-related protein n=1 Tax=Roseospira goensis TaxID=391922 RepID=A0A7W6WKI2_9PROT|nr:cryptochrome/photolyase family protein [Roseospira goensis]MBB4285628.1 deoxyribodipyrimidine photolyase-related protein [Roseospira goensis]
MAGSGAGGVLRPVLGDQLTRGLASLRDLDAARDTVLMAEVMAECTYVPHHPRKIVLVLAAMRQFAAALAAEGVRVRYVTLDDPDNTGTLTGEVSRAAAALAPARVVATEPGEWRVQEAMQGWGEAAGCPVDIRADTRFIAARDDFARWAHGRKTLRMELFYRQMRRRTGLLMTADGAPEGGRWNLDAENRKPPPPGARAFPLPPSFPPDETTRAVMDLVAARFGTHFGDMAGFDLPVTAAQAETALERFIAARLPRFGDLQDAMVDDAPYLFHAVLSPALNIGLLDPLDVCRRAEAAWHAGAAPLNAVEGFIRQILGWREYVRGLYWHKMPGYRDTNALDARRPLPAFFWTGETPMRCLAQAIGQTRRLAYAHHIQRLMVIGNFALLAGLDPTAVNAWYMVVYADAFEWVELPNTHGMALFADGGVVASKPYAASAKYIQRMSTYCDGCRYDPGRRSGPGACPYNVLYWTFLERHRDRFARNPRMAMIYRTLDRLDPAERVAMAEQAAAFLDGLDRDAWPAAPGGQDRLPL